MAIKNKIMKHHIFHIDGPSVALCGASTNSNRTWQPLPNDRYEIFKNDPNRKFCKTCVARLNKIYAKSNQQ